MGVLPRVILPCVTTNCSVHFKFGIFTYNGHNRNVNFSMNSTEKMLSYQNCRFIFINLQLPVVYLTFPRLWHFQHSHAYTCTCNLFLDDGQQWLKNSSYNVISWKHVRKYSQQICNSLFVDIICIGLYMLVSVTYSAIICMCNCGVKHGMRLSKMVRYLYKMILITQKRSAVWLN